MKNYLTIAATTAIAVVFTAASSQAAVIITSIAGGTEGNSAFSDTSSFAIDGAGSVAGNADFSTSGSILESGAFSTNFSFTLQGISTVDTATGAKLTDGGIDRDNSGKLGVRGGSNGINPLEGFLAGINANSLPSGLEYRITGIGVSNIDGTETGKIVSRKDPSLSVDFGASGTGSTIELSTGTINVSDLDLRVSGGETNNEIVSLFALSGNNFRVTSFTLDVAEENKITLDPLGSGTENQSSDSSLIDINGSGEPVDPNAGNGFEDFNVFGSTDEAGAFNSEFRFIVDAMTSVDQTTGAKLADGRIDRASNGDFGVRTTTGAGGNGGNGMGADEGMLIGIDATDLDPSLAYRISDVRLNFVGGDENGKIVNRNDPSQFLTFGIGSGFDIGSPNGLIDVTSLDLTVNGGVLDNEILSIFGANYTSGGGFRVTEFKLEVIEAVVIPEPSTMMLLGLTACGMFFGARRR